MINIGVVGTGIMGQIYGDILARDRSVNFCGVLGNTAEGCSKFAKDTGFQVSVGGFVGKFIEDNGLDAIVIATPEEVRDSQLHDAVDGGVAILVEKPFATSVLQAVKNAQLLADYDAPVAVCNVLRFNPRFFELKRAVTNGMLGSIRHASSRRDSNTLRAQRVAGKTRLEFWLSPHDVDVFHWLTGEKVTCARAWSGAGGQSANDYLLATLVSESGTKLSHQVSWCTEPLNSGHNNASFEVWGTNGYASAFDSPSGTFICTSTNGASVPDTHEHFAISDLYRGMFETMLSSFIDRVETKDKQSNDLHLDAALEVTIGCAMIGMSLDQNRTIYREEIVGP